MAVTTTSFTLSAPVHPRARAQPKAKVTSGTGHTVGPPLLDALPVEEDPPEDGAEEACWDVACDDDDAVLAELAVEADDAVVEVLLPTEDVASESEDDGAEDELMVATPLLLEVLAAPDEELLDCVVVFPHWGHPARTAANRTVWATWGYSLESIIWVTGLGESASDVAAAGFVQRWASGKWGMDDAVCAARTTPPLTTQGVSSSWATSRSRDTQLPAQCVEADALRGTSQRFDVAFSRLACWRLGLAPNIPVFREGHRCGLGTLERDCWF